MPVLCLLAARGGVILFSVVRPSVCNVWRMGTLHRTAGDVL